MSRVIQKFSLGSRVMAEIELPAGAECRHVALDKELGEICVWMEVDNEFTEMEMHTFGIFNTDDPIPDDWTYLQSIPISKLVLHVHHYDRVELIVVDEEESE